MTNLMKKLTSRKFLAALSCIVTGFIMMFTSEEIAQTITGGIMSILASVVYIYTEGKIDENAVTMVSSGITEIAKGVDEAKENVGAEVVNCEEK